MKEKLFKYSIISLIITNIWSLYMLFDYFLDDNRMFSGYGLLYNFLFSLLGACSLALIFLLLRLYNYLKKKTNSFKANFLYIFCGIFNLYLFIVWLTCVILKVLDENTGYLPILAAGTFLASIIISFDFYKSTKKNVEYKKPTA